VLAILNVNTAIFIKKSYRKLPESETLNLIDSKKGQIYYLLRAALILEEMAETLPV